MKATVALSAFDAFTSVAFAVLSRPLLGSLSVVVGALVGAFLRAVIETRRAIGLPGSSGSRTPLAGGPGARP